MPVQKEHITTEITYKHSLLAIFSISIGRNKSCNILPLHFISRRSNVFIYNKQLRNVLYFADVILKFFLNKSFKSFYFEVYWSPLLGMIKVFKH